MPLQTFSPISNTLIVLAYKLYFASDVGVIAFAF